MDDCKHHWIIEAAKGAKSPGVCRRCGETRMFQNRSPGPRRQPSGGRTGQGAQPEDDSVR